ncbi:hypothetical protein JG687_00004674 [Phytophthora cactorum]|uniref:Uncharacterized protein n=1 Tax=Phytophthora cactorum TaxID=29920 RepID=A0A329SJS3_9STRA|nr:hypothetical protein PC111_g18587 [Phytophthora cactorum]KAG2849526.1 hypothetical protein PC113_g17389 [Phytophthora cactorum]KAG2913639.1 hypothetical protein PC117_g18519 [Phytophthora cactorum]KAG2966735.1 hypothetical protein PC118_g18996 [Phytophthora cactorum]KAG2982599.1 hypothetical protein PC119_g20795 [Phytophthora cactorum]
MRGGENQSDEHVSQQGYEPKTCKGLDVLLTTASLGDRAQHRRAGSVLGDQRDAGEQVREKETLGAQRDAGD